MRRLLLLSFAALFIAGLATAQDSARPKYGAWGIDLSALDRDIKPGDNFADFTSGAWAKGQFIPGDRSSVGSFADLQIQSGVRLQGILGDLANASRDRLSSDERKLRAFYVAYIDTDGIENRGVAPIRADMARIAAIKDLNGVARVMGSVPMAIDTIFNLNIDMDAKDPSIYRVRILAGGLGMPDRDYYLRQDKESADIRTAYRDYAAKMLDLAGFDNTKARADALLALETRIADAHWSTAEKRDENATYNPITISELKKLAPDFDWDPFLDEAGVTERTAQGSERVIVAMENTAFAKLGRIFAETPVPVWQDFLRVHYLHTTAEFLPKRFDDTDFAFFGGTLTGRTQKLDRRTRAGQVVDLLMGEALGKLYVEKYFPAEAKVKALALVNNLLAAYRVSIQSLDWMSPDTKAKALDKLAHLTTKIAYPDTWRDYTGLVVAQDDPLGNYQRGIDFEWTREIGRVDRPADRAEWGLTPSTVNAYYQASFNEIVFPAAILQPPFFDPNADDAVNYGAIGAVIGHEISHGFDDQGSKYDAFGRMSNWWASADEARFQAKTGALTAQFDKYEVLPGLFVNGKNTVGENIADLAGAEIALKAYHLSLGGKPAPVIDGYTGDQRFFLGYGQMWRSKFRDSALRTQVLTDVHAPRLFRVIGVTRNMDAWYDAFGVKPGDKYYLPPDQRIKLW